MGRKSLLLLFLITLGAYLYGIQYLPFRGEEANRLLTAYEMDKLGNWFNPTHLGEPYYLKPPLFMDLEIVVAKIFGWHEWVGRIISVASSLGAAFLTYLLAKELSGDKRLALLSALILLTLGDLAVFYGFVAEIDAFHTFLFTLGVYLFYTLTRRERYSAAFVSAGLITALSFLTKGFPAFYHLPLSALLILTFQKRLRLILSRHTLEGLIALFIPLAVWYVSLQNPHAYLSALWSETFARVEQTDKLSKTLSHLLTFPLLTFKQLLPYSLLALLILIKEKSRFAEIFKNKNLLLLAALFLLNYLPYWLSPAGRGRYVLITFPLLAVLFAHLLRDLLPRPAGVKFLKLLPAGLFLIALPPLVYYHQFFLQYGWWQLLLLLPLAVAVFYTPRVKEVSLLTVAVLSVLVFKVGFVNYGAPYKERKNPAREIALALSPAYPPEVIRYLPPQIYMELCAYTDLYTGGLVLRRGGEYFLTDEKHLPRSGFEILKKYRGWVAGRYR